MDSSKSSKTQDTEQIDPVLDNPSSSIMQIPGTRKFSFIGESYLTKTCFLRQLLLLVNHRWTDDLTDELEITAANSFEI
ncbi:unnamed protein product [Dibothriocephalus latus]|uniref:Uncharacterized protein n=1 Tax=Dibothriocephalus latus TaxID=60516 RepID=A0A3P7LJL7_DIBLA|nr:unnamed protein product [Dibothriocephalus latus]